MMTVVSFKGGYMDGKSLCIPGHMRVISVPENRKDENTMTIWQIFHRYSIVRAYKNKAIGIYEGFELDSRTF